MKGKDKTTHRTGRARETKGDRLEGIVSTLRAALPELRSQYGVQRLGLFGSYVRGDQNRRSDLDVLVELDDKELTLLQFIALENELSEILGVKVDLVEKNTLKPAIGRHVLQEVVAV